jgi:hypothetical protein
VSKRSEPARTRARTRKERDKLSRLAKHPNMIIGDPAAFPRVPSFDEAAWRRKWDKRLKPSRINIRNKGGGS